MSIRSALLTGLALCCSMASLAALAGGKGSNTMDCNAQAAGKSDAEREAFLEACMAGNNASMPAQKQAAASPSAQPGNKSACQTEAQSRGLQGNERKDFMAACMDGSGGH